MGILLFLIMCMGFILGAVFNGIVVPWMYGPKFYIGKKVFWKNVKEVGEDNNKWEVSVRSGEIVSFDKYKLCVKDGESVLFVYKNSVYPEVWALKKSIGAELNGSEYIDWAYSDYRP